MWVSSFRGAAPSNSPFSDLPCRWAILERRTPQTPPFPERVALLAQGVCHQAVAEPAHGFEEARFLGLRFQFLAQLPDQVVDLALSTAGFLAPDRDDQLLVGTHHRHIAI